MSIYSCFWKAEIIKHNCHCCDGHNTQSDTVESSEGFCLLSQHTVFYALNKVYTPLIGHRK